MESWIVRYKDMFHSTIKNSVIPLTLEGSYVIIMTVVKSLIKSRVLVLLQNIKTLKNSNLCVV